MAQKKKSSKRTTAAPRGGKRPAAKKKNSEIRVEIWEWILLLLLLLLVLGVFLGSRMGTAGAFLNELLVGIFGLSAYFIVLLSLAVMGWKMFSSGRLPGGKIAGGYGLLVILSVFMHLLNGDSQASSAELFARASYKNGGWLGGALGNLLLGGVGFAGSILILVGIALVLLILITEHSFVKDLSKAGDTARKKAQQIHLDRSREKEARSREKEDYDIVIRDGSSRSEPKEKRPIRDGSVDIPLLEKDTYTERKKRFQERQERQVNRGSGAGEPSEPLIYEKEEVLPERKEKRTVPEREPQPVKQERKEEKRQTQEEPKGGAVPMQPRVDGEAGYRFPSLDLLTPSRNQNWKESKTDLLQNAKVLEDSLMSFGVDAKVIQVNRGPAVTRYELQPKQGVKVSKIVNLADDIALNLAAPAIRIEAPIPGKSAVGIEVPNKETSAVMLREVLESSVFQRASSKLTFALGKNVDGEIQVGDIARMPHLLIAGATGSGKSVCINSIIVSLLYKADPREVRMILIDPKVVELSVYNGIPHLLLPVVNDPKKAAVTLNWAVQEMTSRYKKFAEMNVRDMAGYNEAVRDLGEDGEPMPQIVIIIDELADLMMVAAKEVEESICRLAQMARAAGIHLVIATQRPSVDVITGLIKANIPSRLAFAVSSGVDSRTILDMVGAEKLLGRGDMLFCPIGASKPTRIQGTFVSDKEVEAVVEAVRSCPVPAPAGDLADTIESVAGEDFSEGEGQDELLEEAIRCVVEKQKASISLLQRMFRIGFNRAARLMEEMEARGIVGPDEGSKPRKVLVSREEWEE